MNQLIEWPGKADELSITYDAGLLKNGQRLLNGDVSDLPAVIYPQSDNPREIVDVTWEDVVKKADRTDYLIALACGSFSGLIDIFYVGEFSLERANTWGTEQTNKFVKKIARLNGFKGDDLSDAISFMEKKFGMAADSVPGKYGGGLQHHLRDFSHHFSLGGLMCSLFTQFTGKVIGTDPTGTLLIVELTDKTFIGNNFEEKLLFGTVNWFFHMVSDMAGSSFTPGAGTGIPGPLLSLIKELSALPCFKDRQINETQFYVWVSKLFNGTLLAKRDINGNITEPVRFNLRTEIGILHEMGRQFIPVLINECLARGTYFLRRLSLAIKENEIHSIEDLKKINAADLLPFNNRVVRRMITVASGTFTAIDAVDAGVRAVIKNQGIHPKTFVDFAVRINIAGIGRFIIACKADGEFITEDIREAKKQRDQAEENYEKALSGLKCLSLNYKQLRLLYSLERLSVINDISLTKDERSIESKTSWESEWEKQLLNNLPITVGAKESFFQTEAEVLDFFSQEQLSTGQYLVLMEALLFKPYSSVYAEEKKNKTLKKLKYNDKYIEEVLPEKETAISKKEIKELSASYKKAASQITGSTKNIVIGAGITGIAVIATGGLAFTFAPVIATTLVGGSAATGLSGAALVSYSLATIGGGALAAGGLGMAGGTAIITGGGALIATIGGAGAAATTTVNLLSDSSYVLQECCKLLAFSRCVLVEKVQDYTSVRNIHTNIKLRLDTIEKDIEQYQNSNEESETPEDRKKKDAKIKVAKKSKKYLTRCEKFLQDLLKSQKQTLPASD